MTAARNPTEWPTNEVRNQAEQRVPNTPADVSGMPAGEIVGSLYELEVHREELTIQNEELRRLQLELESSHERFADLYDFAPVGYVTVDANGSIINANLATATMLGQERSKIVGTRLGLYCDEGSRTELRDHLEQVLASELIQSCELKFATANRATLDVRLHSNRIVASGTGDSWQCRVIMADITRNKVAETTLRESESLFRTIFEQAAVGVAQLNSVSGVILRVNGTYCEILETPAEMLTGKTWMELTHPDDLAADLANMERLRAGDIREFSIEKRMERRDGSFAWINLTVSPTWQPGEAPSTHIAIVEDITARKQAEAERGRLLDILQRSLNEIYVFDSETLRFEYVNAGALRNLGYSLDAMRRMTPVDIKPEYSETTFRDLLVPLQSGKLELLHFETLHQRADGSRYPVEVHLQSVRQEYDELFLAVILDITERKQAEQALRQRDQAFRTAITPIAFCDLDGRITDANQALAELLGFANVEPLIGKLNTDIPSTPISIARINKSVIETGSFNGEITIQGSDGKPIEIQLSATLFADAEGRPTGMMATFMDVTPRRQVERALRESEQRTRTLVEAAPEAIVVFDADEWRFIDVNENATKLFRVERERLLELGPIDLSPKNQPSGQDSAKSAMDYIQQALDGEMPVFEWMHVDFEGNEVPCEVRLVRLPSSRRLIRASVTNISERIELKNALSRRAFEAELLYRAVAMADEVDSLDAALQKCVDIVCELTSWPLGHVYVPSASGEPQLEPTKIWHFADEQRFKKFRELSERTSFEMDQGLPGRIWSSGEPAWIANVQKAGNFLRDKLGEDLGVKGAFGFPVRIKGKTAAILEFFNEREVERNETLLLFVRSVGEQVGRAIERKLAEEALRRSDEQLRELNTSLERRVAERTAELAETNAELDAFARTVSHDLRSPLRAMEGFAAALAEDYGERLDEKGHQFIQHIVDSAQRMDGLVSDLLAYSRLGRAKLSLTPISLSSIVDEALNQLSADIKACNAKIAVAERLPTVLGHRSTLVHIVTNLLSNGIKFTAEGVQSMVRVWAEPTEEATIRLWFEDNGIGIATEYQGVIFRVFERLHGIESYPGTGIGLAIVARACERLGGRCGLESQLGQGSRFWVEFPQAKANQ